MSNFDKEIESQRRALASYRQEYESWNHKHGKHRLPFLSSMIVSCEKELTRLEGLNAPRPERNPEGKA